MSKKNKDVHYTAIFSHYVAVKHEPHYVFTTEQALLVKCRDYPDMIGELNAYDRVKLTAEVQDVNCNELLTPYCNELLTPLGSIKTVKIQLSFKFKYILILIKI